MEDVWNESSEAIKIPVDTSAKQHIGTSSTINLVYTSLKHLENNVKRFSWGEDITESNVFLTAFLQESKCHIFGKKIFSQIIESECSKKQPLEVFKGSNGTSISFLKGPLPNQNKRQGGRWYYYTTKSKNWDQNKNIQF